MSITNYFNMLTLAKCNLKLLLRFINIFHIIIVNLGTECGNLFP